MLLVRRPQGFTKRKSDTFIGAAFAFHRHVNRVGFVRLQLEGVGHGAFGQPLRCWVEQHRCTSANVVEAKVTQHNYVSVSLHMGSAAASTAQPPHFK